MNRINSILSTLAVLLTTAMFALSPARAMAGDTSDHVVTTPYWKAGKPLLYQKGNTGISSELEGEHKSMVHAFPRRRALVGRNCVVNDIFSTVGVASIPAHLGNITNDTLSDYATFAGGVDANLGYSDLTSVRDMTHHYAAGTVAGFCIVSESGGSVLTLDVIKKFTIEFYCEGEKVGSAYAGTGSEFNGVKLSLITLPGSSNASCNIQATSEKEFDEVRLVNTGIEAKVISAIDVKYAYVGTPKTYTLTKGATSVEDKSGISNFSDYCSDYGKTGGTLSAHNSLQDKLINADLTDGGVIAQLLGNVVSTIPVGVNAPTDGGETFAAGTSVGFRMHSLKLGDLQVGGGGILITLTDHNGKAIKSYQMGMSVLGLNLLSGSNSSNVIIEADVPFSGAMMQYISLLGLTAGITHTDYAYVTPAPDIDERPAIDPSADLSICDEQTSVQLYHNDKVPVTWSVVEGNAKIDENGLVTGMNGTAGTKYVFRATATDGSYTDVTVTKNVGGGDPAGCRNKITAAQGFVVDEKMPGVTASLISISHIDKGSKLDNLLDGNPDTYVKYVPGAEIAGHVGVVAIKVDPKKSGATFRSILSSVNAKAAKDSIKMGFVIQNKGDGLNLNLLNDYSFKFFKNGENVYTEQLNEANVLGLDLIGSSKLQKLELAATVPADIDFDEMALYHDGVLGVNLSEIDFFYPFYEVGQDISICDDPLGCDPQVLHSPVDVTTSTLSAPDGPSIDGNITGTYGTVKVASGINHLSYLLDNDLTTGVTMGSVAQVGGGFRIGVKLGRQADYRQQLAIIMDDNNYQKIFTDKEGKGLDPLGIGAGHWMKVETYLDGKATGDSKTDWAVLGADVLTTKGHNIYVWNPHKKYDEVVITIAAVADVAKVQKIYAIALQSDIDGDGIPDCKDTNSCNGAISNTNNPHACKGETVRLTFTGKKGFTYKIIAADQGVNLLKAEAVRDTLDDMSNFAVEMPTVKSGMYSARIMQEKASSTDGSGFYQDGEIFYTVHPTITHWNPNTTDTDWNTWSNWLEGSPYKCTDVVIPSGSKVYPVLQATGSSSENVCNNIHFESGAAVENVYRLTYGSAWVDLKLTNLEPRLFMAPLAGIRSGDFFTSTPEEAKYFTTLTDDNDADSYTSRTAPYLYQRMWKKSVEGDYDGSGYLTTTLISKATWSHAFNSLHQDYSTFAGSGNEAPACFSLMADNNDRYSSADFYICLPKAGTRTYHYYGAIPGSSTGSEKVDHGDNSGRLWSSVNWTKAENEGLKLVYSGDSKAAGNGIFLVGNPMMSHLDVAAFLKGNTTIDGIKLYSNNTAMSIINVDGKLLSSGSTLTDAEKYIEPSAAFFVQAKETTSGDGTTPTTYPKTLSVLYDNTMYGNQPGVATKSGNSRPRYSTEPAYLRMTATDGSHTSGALLLQGSEASAATLIDEDYKPALAAFAVKGNKAMDICSADSDVIPLGYILSEGDSVKLSFTANGGFDTTGWRLYDRETGLSYDLDETPTIWMSGSNSGRLYLSRIGETTNIGGVTARENGLYVTIADDKATVKSSSARNIASAAVYTADGSITAERTGLSAASVTLPVGRGIVIVKVTLTDGISKTFKLMNE